MTRELSDLEHLFDAAEALRDIQARRPAIALFQSDSLLSASDREAVFRGRYDGAPAVLTLFHGEGHTDRARAQKRDLARLDTALAEAPYRVAPLIAAWPGEGITVTADMAGVRLDRALADAPPETRDALLAEAGTWLAHVVAQANRKIAFGGRHWVRRATRALGHVDGRSDRPLARQLANRLEALLPTVAGKPVTQTHGHGDFRPEVLVQAEGVLFGLAFRTVRWQPVMRDVARFLVALHLACPRPGGRRRFGVEAGDIEALLSPLTILDRRERALHLPFFIGVELADALARGDLTPQEAEALAEAVGHFLGGEATPLL
ncbi:MAG: hypothetical protein ACP5EN_18130 [Rhodovulum sp.]